MKINNVVQLGFDDVMLKPKKGIVDSRDHVRTEVEFGRPHEPAYRISIPIMSSPMETVTEGQMARAMHYLGGMGVIHRFMPIEDQALMAKNVPGSAIAFGINDTYAGGSRGALDRVEACKANFIVMDIAHADSERGIWATEFIKNHFPYKFLIAGSVATAEGAHRLFEAGADALRVGIGSGYACTTRLQTGHGVKQLTAIAECARVAKEYGRQIVADGGIRSSGDIVKALAAGADCVMLGSLLAGADEAPKSGEYFGQASVKSKAASQYVEGDLKQVPMTGPVSGTIHSLMAGVRSGISYSGGKDIKTLQENAEFLLV